jgi:hypothetical protein
MYDYYLGGAHNFAVDRDLARQVLELYPNGQLMAQANRAFPHRAVRFLASARGVRQFIDIGSGIPIEGNIHETAEQEGQPARVLYIDHDPVAVAHSEILLDAVPNSGILHADLRDPVLAAAVPADRPVRTGRHPHRRGPAFHPGRGSSRRADPPVPGGGRPGQVPGDVPMHQRSAPG